MHRGSQSEPIDGISLRGVIDDDDTVRAEPIGFRFSNSRSWVSQQYKLISKDNGATFELYDLLADEGEQNNIAAANPDIVARMIQELEAWLAAVAADTEYVAPSNDPTVVLSTSSTRVAGEFRSRSRIQCGSDRAGAT